MEVRRWEVFLDTSALIAGVVSAAGAAREVLRLGEARVIDLVISRQVLTEADRNISSKLPTLLADYRMLLEHLALQIVEDPSVQAVREAARVIHHKDAPILAAARQAAPGLPPEASDGPANWDMRAAIRGDRGAAGRLQSSGLGLR